MTKNIAMPTMVNDLAEGISKIVKQEVSRAKETITMDSLNKLIGDIQKILGLDQIDKFPSLVATAIKN